MKKKKNKVLLISIISLIVIGLIVAAGLFLYFRPTGQNTVGSYKCTGGQVLSISDAQIYTNANLGGKKVIRVHFSTLPSSECLFISLKPADINANLSDADKATFQATNTILGDIRLTKEQKVYNINERTGEEFRTFQLPLLKNYAPGTCWDWMCTNQEGSSVFASNDYPGTIPNPDKCYCSKSANLGINGEFSSSTQLNWTTIIDIGSDSTTLTPSILANKIGNIAYAQWTGNWATNVNLESINRNTYKPYSTNQWRMIDSGTYTDLNNKYTTIRSNLISCDSLFGDCRS